MRLHVISLPHSQTTTEYGSCAFTEKVRKFCDMMSSLDYEVILYAGDENEASCDKLVTCITREEQRRFDIPGPERVWDASFDFSLPQWVLFNARAIEGLNELSQPGDYLCLMAGVANQSIVKAHPELIPVEFGIGYPGSFAPFRVFESYAWMHASYASQQGLVESNGNFYDAVIPSYFEADAFPAGKGGDYLLFMGRLTARKGLAVVRDVAKTTGLPLVVAGGGDERLIPEGADYRGVVGPKERAELLGGARALLVPTLYLEPFGSVTCEAMMTGTPVITTDWGAFPELFEEGVHGYHCRTLQEFNDAAFAVPNLNRRAIRKYAMARYNTDNVRFQYDKYFKRLETLKKDGWYTLEPASN